MIKPGLVSITFRKLSSQRVIDLANQAGLIGIEWGGDVHVPHGDVDCAKRTHDMTVEAGLEVAAYGSYYRAGVSEEDGLSFDSVLASAVALRAPTIRVWAGNCWSNEVDGGYRQSVADDLRRVSAMAADKGITISAEYHAKTLTDRNESAQLLFQEVNHPNFKFYWQPPNGESKAYCQEGLEAILENVTNLHIFHWRTEDRKNIRLPLEEGADRWADYLSVYKQKGKGHVLMEFVKQDDLEQFLTDAAVLKKWLQATAS